MRRSSSGCRRRLFQIHRLAPATWFAPIVANGKKSIKLFNSENYKKNGK